MAMVYALLFVLVTVSIYRTCGVKKKDARSLLQSDYKEFLRITKRLDTEESWHMFLDLIYKG